MTIFQALLSGIVQGLTEFLPVSSSGHLALLQNSFGWSKPAVFFDICLHGATVFAVVLYFFGDIVSILKRRDVKMMACIIIATIPAAIAGLLFEDKIEAAFGSSKVVSALFFVTAAALFAGQWAIKAREAGAKAMSYPQALFVGIVQVIALLPGVSRSGMTVSSGLVAGVKKEEAFKFAFIISIPIILAALAYKVLNIDISAEIGGNAAGYITGILTAFVVGMASLFILERVIKAKKLYIFAVYCCLLGVVGILFL